METRSSAVALRTAMIMMAPAVLVSPRGALIPGSPHYNPLTLRRSKP
jgi:hypothetical protein